MNLLNTIIISDRLKLVPTSEKYTQEIFSEFTPEITTFMFPKPATKIEETISFIKVAREKMENGQELQMAILLKDTGEFIGHAGAHKINTDIPELGIWIKKSAHGYKYGQETMQAIKKWLDQNVKYQYIKYPVDKRNIASRKIAQSLGGVVKKEYQKENMSGRILDEVEYWIYPQS